MNEDKNLFEILENGNHDNIAAPALATSNPFTLRINSIQPVYEYGPSGVPKNLKKYRLELYHSTTDLDVTIVRAASISNMDAVLDTNTSTLTVNDAIGDVFDSSLINIGDIVLIKNQNNPLQNGVYTLESLSPLTFVREGTMFYGRIIAVNSEGSLANTYWKCTYTYNVNYSPIYFTQIVKESDISDLFNIDTFHVGQELLIHYPNKPSLYSYLPEMYGQTMEECITDMDDDIKVTVLKIDQAIAEHIFYSSYQRTWGLLMHVDVLSKRKLYYYGQIVANHTNRNTVQLNNDYPTNIYASNFEKIPSISGTRSNVTIRFDNENANAVEYTIAFREIRTTYSNTQWIYITTPNKYVSLNDLTYDAFFEVKVMTHYKDDVSVYSPSIKIKTV